MTAPPQARCRKHEWVRSDRKWGAKDYEVTREVTCKNCGKRPACYRLKDLRLNDGEVIKIGNHLHSQGETKREAECKAVICGWLEQGHRPPVKQCRHCGFWTI